MSFKELMEQVGEVIDGFGVAVIVIGVLFGTLCFFHRLRLAGMLAAYNQYRQTIGRSILLGLELLVGGDIIRTVAVSPTLSSVAVLAVIVAIRTILSMSIQLELEGRWPWQNNQQPPRTPP